MAGPRRCSRRSTTARMPPWHASPDHGQFANSRLMPEADKEALRNWVRGGMPYGDVADLPEPRQFQDEWQLAREPDAVFEMRDRPFIIPSQGVVEYQYFVVDPGFEHDVWVRGGAGDSRQSSRRSSWRSSSCGLPMERDSAGWGGSLPTSPVNDRPCCPKHHARRIPAGSLLVFPDALHTQRNGTGGPDPGRSGV